QKAGVVAIIGRPNAGKSTLLNNLLGHKVAITSPKPQTTRFAIQAVYEDDRGQIIFVDTPGMVGKVVDPLSRRINLVAENQLNKDLDLVIYLVDHTRERDLEENKTFGLVRKFQGPKILVINKIDVARPTHIVQYKFMEEEFDAVVEISALGRKHLGRLIQVIFDFLPDGKPMVETGDRPQPGLNIDSKTFLAEIIREKAFLFLRREVPYSLTTVIDDVIERDNGVLYVKARILTSADRYKSMIIGKNGVMIKEISMAARKELETATDKKVYLELTVETDPHWMDSVT
ncbi:GTPase Era, partial [Candidatus Gottesmanbacteria bacterium]|nr:GTPase Era [Candidatus Gottesmanbacteria bacterium]